MEPFFAQKEKAKETEQIKTRRTAYPYGINDKIGDETSANEDELISTKLPVLKHKYLCTCGINYAKVNVTSGTKKYINFKELQNCILQFICVWSLSCSIQVYTSQNVLPIPLENQFFIFLRFLCCFSVLHQSRCNLYKLL